MTVFFSFFVYFFWLYKYLGIAGCIRSCSRLDMMQNNICRPHARRKLGRFRGFNLTSARSEKNKNKSATEAKQVAPVCRNVMWMIEETVWEIRG